MPCPYRDGLEWRNEVLLPEKGFNAEIHEMLFDAQRKGTPPDGAAYVGALRKRAGLAV